MWSRFPFALLAAFALLAVLTPSSASATPPGEPVLAEFRPGPAVLRWEPLRQAERWDLRITTPAGAVLDFTSPGVAPVLTFQELESATGGLADGSYTWELAASLDVDAATGRALRDARAQGGVKPGWVLEASRDLRRSGSFRVASGRFVFDPDAVEPEAGETGDTARAAVEGFGALRGVAVEQPATGHAIFTTSGPFGPNGHGISDSLCVGAGCTTSEDYGTDTIRLRESNLRIAFDDSSSAGGTFPLRDWEILANDQADGGLERFSIHDVTGGGVPFTVEGASPGDALYVDAQGRVGLGTATPGQRLHVRTGDTPGIRFEQDATQSFPAQTWELAGNDDEFFLRDHTGGNQPVPFRVEAGTPADALVLTSGGRVGVGTDAPAQAFHVARADGTAMLLVEETGANPNSLDRTLMELKNNGPVNLVLGRSDGDSWRIRATDGGLGFLRVYSGTGDYTDRLQVRPNGGLKVTDGQGTPIMILDASGNLKINGGLQQFVGFEAEALKTGEPTPDRVTVLEAEVAELREALANLEALLDER